MPTHISVLASLIIQPLAAYEWPLGTWELSRGRREGPLAGQGLWGRLRGCVCVFRSSTEGGCPSVEEKHMSGLVAPAHNSWEWGTLYPIHSDLPRAPGNCPIPTCPAPFSGSWPPWEKRHTSAGFFVYIPLYNFSGIHKIYLLTGASAQRRTA